MSTFEEALSDWNRGVIRARTIYQLETSCRICGTWRPPSARMGMCESCRARKSNLNRKKAKS